MSIARKILWNTFAQIAGKLVISALGIVVLSLITKYLGGDDAGPYGEYSGAFDHLAFFTIIADLGLFTVGVREMTKDEKKIPMIVGNILTVRTLVAIAMVAVAVIAAFCIPQYQDTRIPLAAILVGISAILNLLTSTISAVLQVHFKMEYNSIASVVGRVIQVIYLVFTIYFLYPGNIDKGFFHLLWAGIIGNACMLGITYYYSRKLTKIRYRFDKEFWKDVIIKALPYGLALVLNTIYFRIGGLLILWTRGTAENGIYNIPIRMIEALGIIPLYFMNSVLPVLTQAIHRKDNKSYEKIIQYAFDFLVMGGLPIVAGAFVLSRSMIALITRETYLTNPATGWIGSDIVLQIIIFALLFSFLNSLFGLVLVADNRQNKLLVRNVFGALLTIILGILLIPPFGVRAAAGISVLTEGYIFVASYLMAKRYLDFKLSFKNTLKIIFSSLVMVAVILLLNEPTFEWLGNKNILILIPLGGLSYLTMLFATKTITKEMIQLVLKRKSTDKASPVEPASP